MALSNWDTMAFDEDGKATNGVMEGFAEGTSCEIYKNWLYVRDRKMWCEDRGYVEPTIAQINSGNVSLSDFAIDAIRGPQSAIFVKVISIRYKKQIDGEKYKPPDVRRLAGIGCYGYEDPHERVMDEESLNPEEWTFDGHGSCTDSEGNAHLFFTFYKKTQEGEKPSKYKEIKRPAGGEYETDLVGVKESTLKEFIKWLKGDEDYQWEDDYKEWVDKIEKAKALRFNQGDMFFANNVGAPLSVTPPGKQEEPMMHSIVNAMSKEPSEEEKS